MPFHPWQGRLTWLPSVEAIIRTLPADLGPCKWELLKAVMFEQDSWYTGALASCLSIRAHAWQRSLIWLPSVNTERRE